MKIISLYIFLIFMSGCKTADQIRRERLVDDLSVQMIESKKEMNSSQMVTANIGQELNIIKEQINVERGQREELEHLIRENDSNSQKNQEAISQRLVTVEEESKNVLRRLSALENVINEQKKYLNSVVATLEKFGKNSNNKNSNSSSSSSSNNSKSSKKKNLDNSSPYDTAMKLFGQGKFAEAQPLLLELSNNSSIKGKSKDHVLHNLGIIAQGQKKYDDALVYFSKIYRNSPNSPYAPNALLQIGVTFLATNKSKEAKQIFENLIEKYPNSKRVATAKKYLSNLKL